MAETAAKKQSRRVRRREKIKNRVFSENDTKYRGPLSYRALRIVAWIALMLSQLVFLSSITQKIGNWNPFGEAGTSIMQSLGTLSRPLFMVASFGLVLSGRRTYKEILLVYGLSFIGVGSLMCLVYGRYVAGLLSMVKADFFLDFIALFLGSKSEVNVFADLTAFILFNYFMCYRPKKFFQGKKIYIFRSFMALPIAYVIVAYILKILAYHSVITLPFYVHPFLTTKAPLLFSLFIASSLWVNNRRKIFERMGVPEDQYHKFLMTKKNSLSFSLNLSLLILVFAAVDFIISIALIIHFMTAQGMDGATAISTLSIYGLGDCVPVIFAIPFVMLYSYTRDHKNRKPDIIIPIVALGAMVLVYLEYFYQFAVASINGMPQ